MNRQEAINYIEDFSWGKTKLGLSRSKMLLEGLGNPQDKLSFIHVAGSNGKGSTCAFLSSILQQAGYKVGLYTSPYLQDFCERIRINGLNIPGGRLANVTAKVKEIAEQMEDHPTQFELITAIAMQYFYEEECDIVVLEVGMGGEFDATNVVKNTEVAVICNVGLEHTEYLGNTIEEIAATKAGIIKPGCDVVCYDGEEAVTEVVREKALGVKADFNKADFDEIEINDSSLEGQTFTYKGSEFSIKLIGDHQVRNAATALEVVWALRSRDFDISDSAIIDGLQKTTWPARFEILSREPLFILDGGHNPQCAKALVDALNKLLPERKFTFILGILADKNYEEVVDLLRPLADRFICLTPASPRALKASKLAAYLSGLGENAEYFEDDDDMMAVQDAILRANEVQTAGVVAVGSLYMAGLIRDYFTKENKL